LNKVEKEVLQLPLDKEKALLKKLEAEYRQALADVNMRIRILQSDEMTVSRVYHLQYQKTIKKQVEAILEKLHSDEFSTIEQFLAESYVDGYVKTGYLLYDQGVPVITPIDQQAVVDAIQNETKLKESLYDELGYDVDELKQSITAEITRGIATGLQYTDIARNIANHASVKMSRAKTIARTESARIQEKATMDAAYKAQSRGADIVKQWSAIFDGKTRPHHRELDGQIRELNKPFTIGTKKAMQPCDFGDAAEDCNCRCTTLIKSRRSLERNIRKRDNFTGELLEFETAKDYAEFKKRYFSEENVKFMQYAEHLSDKHHVERLDDLWDTLDKDERKRFIELKNASPMWKTTGQNTAETLKNKAKNGIIKADKVVSGHESTPKKSDANTVIDHIGKNGTVNVRSFYGADGVKVKDIHTDDHGFPKQHPFGKHGEHAHDYTWDENGRLKEKTTREVTDEERERNGDIL
jgi:SPP1 gp7 family putative phage head morphogenesis protein